MEGAIFQPRKASELSSFVYVALHLEARIEGSSETITAGWLIVQELEVMK